MNDKISGIINEYCYVSPCDFSNITTTTNITGTSGSYTTLTTTDLPYNYYITGDKIIDNPSNGTGIISSNTTIGSSIISLDSDYFKSGLIKNLLDRIIEIRSLIKNNSFYEIFDIKKISFLKDKTKIVCTKNIDIDYLNELKKESILLLECIDVPTDNYKEKAINGDSSSLKGSVIWTTDNGSLGSLTINPYVTVTYPNNFNWTYGTNNTITYTA